ncbi:phenylacetic acid degradation operon negative regulatory protein [Kineococcus xinjiangensis]|uniref:Phenylacetic acid degradation operon negative regulatory protein n=1 Tax=Kineococcus xinjiangensis TaxID=512762 RepID=A0A2S6IHZ1_9ACTN|nr:PaaX family transcriptional regulator C-terminal domain-containing protein [Kineococcus xinjiangensis]PPK93790.1 phenylacetic acid degradation operon negative regulatory protein [Kineococcus xinjiangensis]
MVTDDPAGEEPGTAGAGPSNPQQLIITLFGLYGRAHGGALPVAALVRLMTDLGVDAPATRSSVSRLKKRGVLHSVKVGGLNGYAIAPELEETFREGDERIFHQRRAGLSDRWLLAVFTVPETQRHVRHRIRSGLIRMGFGSVAPGVWIGPEHLREAVDSYMGRHELSPYVDYFLGEHIGTQQTAAAVREWWDLPALEQLYAQFAEHCSPVSARWTEARAGGAADPELPRQAFADYVPLVTEWRRLPYLDPGLPLELLPPQWRGLVAERLFAELDGLLRQPAAAHVAAVTGG